MGVRASVGVGIGPEEDAFRTAVADLAWSATAAGNVIRGAVAESAGRMGRITCEAIVSAPDLKLTGRAQSSVALLDVLGDADVVVD